MNHRVYSILVFAFLATCLAKAQEPFFCVTPGTELYYERTSTKNGKLSQTTLFEISSVENKDEGCLVSYCVTMKDHRGKDIFGGRTALTVDVAANGDTYMDFGESVRDFVKNILKDINITTTGNAALLPADMKPGDSLPDAHCELRWGMLSLTLDVIDRKVLRTETITTPAGTFECVVAREHKIENGPMHYVDTWSDSWYSKGIGYVRHDVMDVKKKLKESEILICIDKR